MNKSYYSYRIFHFMLLAFIAFHMAISSPGWSEIGNSFLNPSNEFFLLTNILVLIFMVLSLFHPEKIIYLVLTIASLTLVKLDALPQVPNHIVLAIIIFFTLLFSLLFYWDKSLSKQDRLGKWYKKVAPYLRIELLIMYFFVVFHKMNYSYFNPDVSCGSLLYKEIAGVFSIFPNGEWANAFSLWSAFGFEFIIPVFLLFRVTRIWGVFLGLIFHFLLSFHPNLYILSFSAELYALYILFLPEDLIEKIWRQAKKVTQSPWFYKTISFMITCLLIIISVYLITSGETMDQRIKNIFSFVQIAWFVWGSVLIIGFVAVAYPWLLGSTESNSIFRMEWNPLLIFPLLVLFNGLTPYIGLKTSTNFSMFSNLKVDGPVNNHWFMTSKYQVAGYQNDTVTLVKSSNPFLQGFIQRDEHLTYFKLKKFLSVHKQEEIQLTYQRNDQLYTLNLPEDRIHDAVTPPAWIANKLLTFRGIPNNGPTPCQW